MRWGLAAFLVWAPLIWAQGYWPGEKLSWERFQQLQTAWSDPYFAHKPSLTPLKNWTTELDRELRPALRELLENPNTFFYFGSFDDPKQHQATDEGGGLRLIGQLFLEKDGEKRFTSFLSFWKYDPLRKRLVLVKPNDAVRVRAEIAPREYAGLSYRMQYGKMIPGVYRDETGTVIAPGVGQAANPDHCNICHGHPKANQEDPRVFDTTEYSSFDGYESFLQFYQTAGVEAQDLEKIRETLKDPRAFLRGRLARLF